MELNMTLQAFVATVGVDGALGGGQLTMKLWALGGQKGWRLGLTRLATASAACVVSQARPRKGRMFRVVALAVGGGVVGQGLATGAICGWGRAVVGGWAEVWAGRSPAPLHGRRLG